LHNPQGSVPATTNDKMGCFGVFAKKSVRADDATEKGDSPRPLHHDSFVSFEKPLLTTGRSESRPTASVPPTIASIRPTTHSKYSAYSGVATSTGPSNDGLRYRDIGRDAPSTGSSKSDEDDAVSARKVDEARRKAEQEEQERRDFFQMM